VFNKPADAADARRILTELMHLPHDVITGFALIDAATGESEVYDELTRLHMRPMAPQELDAYIASGLWQGKAGAYGVQDHDDAFVTHLDGSFQTWWASRWKRWRQRWPGGDSSLRPGFGLTGRIPRAIVAGRRGSHNIVATTLVREVGRGL
jgi:hypothetical protein